MVDEFSIKHTSKHNAKHIINALRAIYTITVNHTGSLYCGLTLAWNCARGHVNTSMLNYIKQGLNRFKHTLALRPEYAPHKWKQPVYGANQQLVYAKEDIPILPPSNITHIQTVVGTLIYYAIAVYNTMLVALGDPASLETKETQKLLTP